MKNKAFTLVELLGVIVLLGILSIVIIPKVGDSLQNSKESALLTQEEQIKKAAYDFLIEHTELLDENDTITIKLGTLKQGGYLPIKIKNPKTKKILSNESTITITKNGNTYNMTLNLIDLENATENIDSNSPILVLNGNYIEYVEVNETYTDPGARAITASGDEIDEEDISVQVLYNNEETLLTTSELKTYSIVYTVTDDENRSTSATRTVIVRDSTAPTIIVPKDTNIHVSELASFNIQRGVIINDNYDNNPTLTVDSTLANIPGTYVITYTATDSSGNQASEKRVIKVNNDYDLYYANLEYIESTGTQYIDTGMVGNQNTGFEIDFLTRNTFSTTKYGSVFGARTSSGLNELQLSTYTPSSETGILRFCGSTYNAGMQYTNKRIKVSLKNKVLTNNSGETTNVSGTFTTPVNITVFALNQNGTIIQHGKQRIYSLKFYDGNTLVRNFVPAMRKNDNEVGLYDLANNRFYTNAGTGTFGTGNPIN